MSFHLSLSIFLTIVCLLRESESQQCLARGSEETMSDLYSCDFEVFGIVQGVFFRKYTQQRATELGLKGWCMNTRDDTVKGVMEGQDKQINEMKHWLQNVGSPQSKIDKAVFSPMRSIKEYSFSNFSVKK